jgi:hypothetical protein
MHTPTTWRTPSAEPKLEVLATPLLMAPPSSAGVVSALSQSFLSPAPAVWGRGASVRWAKGWTCCPFGRV